MSGATKSLDLITVVVGRFEPVVHRGLVDILREDSRLSILGSDLEHPALERAVARHAPRVVILDRLRDGSAVVRLRSGRPETEVLVLAPDPTPAYGMGLLAAGATCVARSASASEILAAVHLAAQGARMFASSDGHGVERRYPGSPDLLTPREAQVLERLSEDVPDKQIALELKIGPRTVHTYVASVLRKLGVASRQELIGMPTPSASVRGDSASPPCNLASLRKERTNYG